MADEDPDQPLDVLVVDDDSIVRKTTCTMVASLGHFVAYAPDGNKALEVMQARRFDVVILDLQMPGLDGIATAREIRRRWITEPRIIGYTSSGDTKDHLEFVRAGASLCLAKPATRRELFLALQSFSDSLQSATRVLVIDDDPVLAAVYKKHLQRVGFVCEVATDPIEGFVRLQVFNPDVVVLDLSMPFKSGAEWLASVRSTERYRSLPVVIVTGLPADSPQVKAALASDATGVLYKSQWTPESIAAAVRLAASKNPARKTIREADRPV